MKTDRKKKKKINLHKSTCEKKFRPFVKNAILFQGFPRNPGNPFYMVRNGFRNLDEALPES